MKADQELFPVVPSAQQVLERLYFVSLRDTQGNSKMAQQIKVFAVKPEGLSWIPRTNKVEGED